jgi:hypothetical protein
VNKKSAKEMELELNEKKILFTDKAGLYRASISLAYAVFGRNISG